MLPLYRMSLCDLVGTRNLFPSPGPHRSIRRPVLLHKPLINLIYLTGVTAVPRAFLSAVLESEVVLELLRTHITRSMAWFSVVLSPMT